MLYQLSGAKSSMLVLEIKGSITNSIFKHQSLNNKPLKVIAFTCNPTK